MPTTKSSHSGCQDQSPSLHGQRPSMSRFQRWALPWMKLFSAQNAIKHEILAAPKSERSMQSHDPTRRDFMKQSLAVAVPAVISMNTLPLAAAESESGAARKLKVVCVGGHPDDPESGCAGTLARYSEQGHAVTVVYLTRGERGIQGKPMDEAAKIRTAECEAACKIMGAKAVFAGQIDGAADFTRTRVDELQKLLAAEAPDLVFTHW